MFNLIFLSVLLLIIFVNYLIISQKERFSVGFLTSILFFINSICVIFLISYFSNTILIEDNISFSSDLDKLIDLNLIMSRFRNTLSTACLAFLSYGLYTEHSRTKNKLFLVLFFIFFALSLLSIVLSFIAGFFII